MSNRWVLLIVVGLCLGLLVLVTYRHRYVPGAPGELNPAESTAKPARIVSLAPNLTEILFALGLGEQVVAVSSDSDYPPEASERRKTGTFWEPDVEAIVASQPDLVVALRTEQHKAVVDSLARLGYKVLALKIEKIEELLAAVEQMGAAAGCPACARHLVNTIRTQMHALQSGLDPTRMVKVLWVVQAEPLRVVGRDTFINEMIELAGGENAIGPTISRYPPISTEEILVCEADVIIQSAMGNSSIDEQQQAARRHWSKYGNLPAVKNNRIFVVGSDAVLRLGPRLGQGLRLVARYLHGAAFAGEHDANTAQ